VPEDEDGILIMAKAQHSCAESVTKAVGADFPETLAALNAIVFVDL
jgi:hypothetical protein